ncbi:NifB/NifX family molybdenum-iron cluster-binding protein [Spirochaetota bacterium]
MKICIPLENNTINSNIHRNLGRSDYLLFYELENDNYEFVDNNHFDTMFAGILTAKSIINKECKVVLTKHCGLHTFRVLNNAGVKVITDISGSAIGAIEKHRNNQLILSLKPNVNLYYGIKTNI